MNWARLILLPLLVLSASLGVTWIVWDHERQAARHELLTQFDYSLGDAVSRVEQRMGTYELLLRGVQSFFTASGGMDRERFRDYVNTLDLDANFSGIQAIGVVHLACSATISADRYVLLHLVYLLYPFHRPRRAHARPGIPSALCKRGLFRATQIHVLVYDA